MTLRLAFISDLHVDYQLDSVGLVASRLAELSPDVFVLAGDVSPDLRMIERTLSVLAKVVPVCCFVPGNHDLWCRSPRHGDFPPFGPDSRKLYEEILPAVTSRAGAVYLPAGPYIKGDVGFVGTTGWYDWSFRNPELKEELSKEVLGSGKWKSLQWMDKVCSYWSGDSGKPLSPEKLAASMAASLDKVLSEVEKQVERIVVVTHFLTHKGFFEPTGEPRHDFVLAHGGSAKLGDVIEAHPKVKRVISGHFHTPKKKTFGNVTVETSPLGYPRERNLPLWEHIQERVALVEV